MCINYILISSTRRRMAIRYRLPTPSATFTSAIFRAKMHFVPKIAVVTMVLINRDDHGSYKYSRPWFLFIILDHGSYK